MSARPFLKWVGGKTQLLPELLSRAPRSFCTYREPCVGGGALFFALQPRCAVLSDANRELVTTYKAVRDDVEEVVERLSVLAHSHSAEAFASVRSETPVWDCPGITAARMIYLNKTGFNGLYRVNRAGRFNVPLDSPKTAEQICDADNLRACSAALRFASLDCCDFVAALADVDPGDFVYCDPPYVPASSTANFTAYTAGGFGWREQEKLADELVRLKRLGAHVMLSNADTPETVELYRSRGLKVEHVQARRNINRDGAKRGPVGEVIVT